MKRRRMREERTKERGREQRRGEKKKRTEERRGQRRGAEEARRRRNIEEVKKKRKKRARKREKGEIESYVVKRLESQFKVERNCITKRIRLEEGNKKEVSMTMTAKWYNFASPLPRFPSCKITRFTLHHY